MTKRVSLLSIFIIFLFCGCFRTFDKLNTLDDYANTFDRKQKIPLKNRKTMSFSEAKSIALANNPTLHAAASSIRSAQYGYYRSLSAWSPELTASWKIDNSISHGYDLKHPPSGIFPEENRFANSVSVKATWLLFNGLARELDILISKLEYDRSAAAADDVKRLLLRAVSYVWCDVLLADEEKIVYQADKAFQDAALTQAEQQFKSGHVSYAAVLNFKILSAKAQSRITLAEYNRQTALNALAALLGYSSNELPSDIKLGQASVKTVELYYDLNFYLEQAVSNRPDLKAEKIQFEKALRCKQSAYAAFMPQVHLFADFSFDNARAKYGNYSVNGSYYNHPAFSYGAVAEWNIFRGFDSWNDLRRRQALEQVAMWGLNKKYLEVTAEVNDALEHCRNTVIQTGIFRSMAEWVAVQRDLIYSEYTNGRETIARLNQAQSELVEAQNNLAIWKIQYQKAAAQFNAALGMEYKNSADH